MKTTLMAFAAIATVGTALPAAAEESMNIQYRDLNLATSEGQQILDRRIDRAARSVCGLDDVATGTRLRSNEARNCYREAKAKAKKQFAKVTEAEQLGG